MLMAEKEKAVCRLCRREGVKLFLKGSRCDSAKCAVVRRNSAPGQHGYRRRPRSEYALRMREKQRAKRYYTIRETQFKRYFHEAERLVGDTGQNLFILFERRLDNIVYRAGMGLSRAQARQEITHGHIAVNGRRVDRPSFQIKPGDVVAPFGSEEIKALLKSNLDQTKEREAPTWLEIQRDTVEVRVASLPGAEEATAGFQPHLIVEISSR
jgi:small subunit ribosomal protein S4